MPVPLSLSRVAACETVHPCRHSKGHWLVQGWVSGVRPLEQGFGQQGKGSCSGVPWAFPGADLPSCPQKLRGHLRYGTCVRLSMQGLSKETMTIQVSEKPEQNIGFSKWKPSTFLKIQIRCRIKHMFLGVQSISYTHWPTSKIPKGILLPTT